MLAGNTDGSYSDDDASCFENRLCLYWYWFMYQNYVLVLYTIAKRSISWFNFHIIIYLLNECELGQLSLEFSSTPWLAIRIN